MKLALLFCSTICCIHFSYSQIINGNFENWSDSVIYDTPAIWNSSNQEPFYIQPTVFKTTDAQEGTFAAHLGVAEIFSDTVGGFVLHGSLNPVTGIPYSDNFEAVAVNYKINLQPNDSLYLVIVRKANGSIVDYQFKPFAFGPPTSWTPQLVPVGNTPQDELLIGFIIGDPNTGHKPHPDSWALVDNVKLLNGGIYQDDLPNYNFEQWEEESVEIPDSWESLIPYLSHLGVSNVVKTTDSFEGNFAIELSTVLLGSDTIPGILSKGTIDFGSGIPFAPVPVSNTPLNIAGAYKLTSTSTDQGVLQIQFLENGNVVGYHEEQFVQNANYTIFNSTIGMFGTPDSMIFTLVSGDNPGTVLTLDALNFDSDLSIQNNEIVSFEIFPNPAQEIVHLRIQDANFKKARIMNLNGESIWESEDLNLTQDINISQFTAGLYIVSITGEKGTTIQKLIIE